MKLDQWAEDIQQEVFTEWSTKYSYWSPGFKVFYGPVRLKPKLMILSLQPGGDEKYFLSEDADRFKKGDFSTHEENTYIKSSNRLAKAVKEIFGEEKEILRDSVILPVIFWRAKSYAEWKKVPGYREMETFSLEKVTTILEKVKPQKILVLGISAGRMLNRHYPMQPEEVMQRRDGKENGSPILIETKIGNTPVSYTHLTLPTKRIV